MTMDLLVNGTLELEIKNKSGKIISSKEVEIIKKLVADGKYYVSLVEKTITNMTFSEYGVVYTFEIINTYDDTTCEFKDILE